MDFMKILRKMNEDEFATMENVVNMLSSADNNSDGYYMIELCSNLSGEVFHYIIAADSAFEAYKKAMKACTHKDVDLTDAEGRENTLPDWDDEKCMVEYIDCKGPRKCPSFEEWANKLGVSPIRGIEETEIGYEEFIEKNLDEEELAEAEGREPADFYAIYA